MVIVRKKRSQRKCTEFRHQCMKRKSLLVFVICSLSFLLFLVKKMRWTDDFTSMHELLPELMDQIQRRKEHKGLGSGSGSGSSSQNVKGRLIDLGAGVRDDDPMFPFVDRGWESLLIDGDPAQQLKLDQRFPNDNAHKVISYITTETIPHLLNDHGFDKVDIDMLKIDIDSFDCFVMHRILQIIEPTVIVMEINVKFPANVRFAMFPGFETSTLPEDGNSLSQMEFNSEKRGHVYGCSLAYQVHDLMRPNGYELLHIDWNNAIYILKESLEHINLRELNEVLDKQKSNKKNLENGHGESDIVGDIKLSSPEQMYHDGYWSRPDRDGVFKFNRDTVGWHELSSRQIFEKLQGLFGIEQDDSHRNHHIYIGEVDGDENELKHGCFDASGELRWYSDADADAGHVGEHSCSISKSVHE